MGVTWFCLARCSSSLLSCSTFSGYLAQLRDEVEVASEVSGLGDGLSLGGEVAGGDHQ